MLPFFNCKTMDFTTTRIIRDSSRTGAPFRPEKKMGG
jgi:hypothetical protein